MHVTPQMVTDCLLLLPGKKPIYVSINEKKTGRVRHAQSLQKSNHPENGRIIWLRRQITWQTPHAPIYTCG